jgi:hypothetical protein
MAKLAWKAWHEVVALRGDLRSGELPLHLFAADLYEVMMQSGKRPTYEDPEQFFALTFPTHNLRGLVRDVVLRVAGRNDKAVRQLELNYGGGKTHTLITLRHLVADPGSLPDLPAVREFTEAIGIAPPRAQVAALCFDNLHVETGMEVRSPKGAVRRLRNPWSLLAYQIAGDEGLKLLHADGKAEELQAPPATADMAKLLALPLQHGMGTLVLLDEVLLYARMKCRMDPGSLDVLTGFFQYLTQAAAKVDRCCIVASLLSSEPKDQADALGRRIVANLYDVFQRQREAAVQPVEKEDVAEVLRRRLFDPVSVAERGTWPQHVIAALKGVVALDDQSAKQGAAAEERYLRSYPFHPDLTEVFYAKWAAGIERFQKTRGVLRTFALALREAESWDTNPLVGPCVFLPAPKREGLSEALRELVTVADTEEHEGKKQAWTGILEGEVARARDIQRESVGLRSREVEQAVVATFLHSQPIGQNAHTRDLAVLIAPGRPDRIELEKGLMRWSQTSFWLDDQFAPAGGQQLPGTWRLGNRPNLNQMHAVAAGRISDDVVRARLLDEIGKVKSLTAAVPKGVSVYALPGRPRDLADDGQFRYAILGPGAACDSGKPSAEARRYLEETTGPEKPRVNRNAVILLAPSRDGIEAASACVRDYLAWEQVRAALKEQETDGNVDVARLQTLTINTDKARGRIADATRQAYCTVVTVSDKDEVQAFKITVTDDPHFTTIKNDPRSRVQDSPIAAEALLPGGPYNLWRGGETMRRVKDLSGAFAQLPHLPKMLQAQAIAETLVDGCAAGAFVLRLVRPDGSVRTWWHSRPDESAMAEPAMELVLPEAAELHEIVPGLLDPGRLPDLWKGDAIAVHAVVDYFQGGNVVQIQRNGYTEPVPIPKAAEAVVTTAVTQAVETGTLWLTSGPASILAEPIPAGILTGQAKLQKPPPVVAAAEILPENLPDAWADNRATALAIATALSQKFGQTLPWKTVRDVVGASLNARFTELDPTSGKWPCDYPSAQGIKLKVATGGGKGGGKYPEGGGAFPGISAVGSLAAEAELEPAKVQDLGDAVPQLLAIKNKRDCPIVFRVRIEIGDKDHVPDETTVAEVNQILDDLKSGFHLS